MMANGAQTRLMATALTLTPTVQAIKVIGIKICSMEKALKVGLMEANSLVNT
jgi:hypothetical protein